MNLVLETRTETTEFAAQELRKYLRRMLGEQNAVGPETPSLRLGLFADFPEIGFPRIQDPFWEDAVHIQVAEGTGVIAGSNPRSVLLAVYRFLSEAGCRWVRPGIDGELIPSATIAELSVAVSEKAAYRHRGICIEGAVSEEHVSAIIDWLPKVGMNAYFIQFREGFTFFERWYAHTHNPLRKAEPFSREDAQAIVQRLEQQIKKRGLLYHAVGHGWTCEPLGLPGLGWEQRIPEEPPAEIKHLIAKVRGKRQIQYGMALNTNLCYSNPQARALIVNDIVRYLREHPDIDLLHFWLADGHNNFCECPGCSEDLPSDFYVRMLNELDEKLTEAKLSTQIVFLIYVDLLWPPEKEKIANPERFTLMFAPITRSYSQTFSGKAAESIPPYVRNQLKFPANVGENLAFLQAWQKGFDGDSFDFDYHMMWAHHFDPGYMNIAKVIYRDVQNLKRIGLDGLISCQAQRVFMPTGLPMVVMGRALWDPSLPFDGLVEDYFSAAFGEKGEECRRLLASLPNFLDELDPWPGQAPRIGDKQFLAKITELKEITADLKKLAAGNLNREIEIQAQSWHYLGIFLEIYSRFVEMLAAWFEGRPEEAQRQWEEVKAFAVLKENETEMVFDAFNFIKTMERALHKLERGEW